MSRTFLYSDPDGDYIYDEDQIMEEFWGHWSVQMIKAGKSHLITRENCIEDWIVVHWATEIKR